MLMALGFSVAVLLALLFGRLAWNVAVKLGQRRRHIDAPAEFLDLQADRDRLRAEYAVLSRKLELRLDDLKSRLVEQMAEVSRNRNRIVALMEEVKLRDSALENKTVEAQSLFERRETLEAALTEKAAEIETMRASAGARDSALGEAQGQVQSLSAALADRDQQIAALRGALTRDVEVVPAIAVGQQEQSSAQDRLQRRITELTKLSAEISDQRQALRDERDRLEQVRRPPRVAEVGPEILPTVPQPLEARLDQAMREADQLALELKRLDDIWAKKTVPASEPGQLPPMPKLEPLSGRSEAPEKRKASGGVANVISLAQRIRALKNDLRG
jgi:chromosome segregation ATPase